MFPLSIVPFPSIISATSLRSTVGDRRQAHTSLHERGPTACSLLASTSRRQSSGLLCFDAIASIVSIVTFSFNPMLHHLVRAGKSFSYSVDRSSHISVCVCAVMIPLMRFMPQLVQNNLWYKIFTISWNVFVKLLQRMEWVAHN